ncbi:conserved hypothetical protein [Mesorhizobium plurifarium]|uniref:DUF488 domain-containing protein n=1 Tax=Mesorhizobium plurifarium TaxID=69974 RepID=A0A090GVK7_MESPL|nr:conserved hypothetical protein [Mesorhizobium plurifarium]
MHSHRSTSHSPTPFFTVGHSNRTLEEFIDILRQGQIGIVVDVRRLPGSRAYPQFGSERLAASLAEAQIGYEIVAPLGGRRGKVDGIPPETNGAWRNRSFHNYADYALSAQFRGGLHRLLALRPRRCAIMCSEAVWWRCHRRIIADHLLAHGEQVFHLMGNGRIEKAEPTLGAVFRDDGSVIYPSGAAS